MKKSFTCSGCGETSGVSGTRLCLLVMPRLRELVKKFHSIIYLFVYVYLNKPVSLKLEAFRGVSEQLYLEQHMFLIRGIVGPCGLLYLGH